VFGRPIRGHVPVGRETDLIEKVMAVTMYHLMVEPYSSVTKQEPPGNC
jgi:hypothetical protein